MKVEGRNLQVQVEKRSAKNKVFKIEKTETCVFRISTLHEFACCDVWERRTREERRKQQATQTPPFRVKGTLFVPKNKHEADFRCDSKSEEAGSQKHVSQKLSLDLMI